MSEIYLQSEILGVPVRYDTVAGTATIKELKKFGKKGYIKYSRDELAILEAQGGITPEIHMIKSIFGGTVIEQEGKK